MFATGLICFLAGAVCAALYANHHLDKRERESYYHGYCRGHSVGYDGALEQQREKDSARAQKAARTRRVRREHVIPEDVVNAS